MNISQIAHYRELLEQLRPKQARSILLTELDGVLDVMNRYPLQMPSHLAALADARDRARESVDQFSAHLDGLQEHLLQQIQSLEPEYLARSYQWYEQASKADTAEYMLDRSIDLAAPMRDYIKSRVMAHSDYRAAGMLIRPGREQWVEHMVACDPLYLIDTGHDMFVPVKQKFNALYQNRLRYYVVRESLDSPIMMDLPENQFGFCLAYNFFHFTPFEIMRAWLREIYTKLRPGGVLAMTYNDCDRKGAVELAERSFACYTPGRLVRAVCESVGFVVEQNYCMDAAVTWAEMRKPGEFRTLRGGQTLAKIVVKSK